MRPAEAERLSRSLEQACGIPQQGLADLGRAAQFVAVTAGGGLDEGGVQDDEALEVAAGDVACDHAGVQPVREVLGEQRGKEHRRQSDVEGDSPADGEQAGEQADEGDGSSGEPQRFGDGLHGDALGGAPGQPAQGQALHTCRGRGEHPDLMGDLGRAAIVGDGPREPSPEGAFVDDYGLAGGRASVVTDVTGPQGAGVFPLPAPRITGERALVVRSRGR
jgi:hypothetical protein